METLKKMVLEKKPRKGSKDSIIADLHERIVYLERINKDLMSNYEKLDAELVERRIDLNMIPKWIRFIFN